LARLLEYNKAKRRNKGLTVEGQILKALNSGWKEEMTMKLTILIMIGMFGLMTPALWLTGTLASMVYIIRHRTDTVHKEWIFAITP
jgi:hypothetical protein